MITAPVPSSLWPVSHVSLPPHYHLARRSRRSASKIGMAWPSFSFLLSAFSATVPFCVFSTFMKNRQSGDKTQIGTFFKSLQLLERPDAGTTLAWKSCSSCRKQSARRGALAQLRVGSSEVFAEYLFIPKVTALVPGSVRGPRRSEDADPSG